jgi:DNA-binding transcriptional ArsR family regulator
MIGFSALSDPTRQRIVALLAEGELCAGDIATKFKASPPAISQHLKVLRDAGLVRVRPDKQLRFYTIDQAGFEEMVTWLARVSGLWNARLDRLDHMLKEARRRDSKR